MIPPDARDRLAELHVEVSITGNLAAGFRASVNVSKAGAQAAPSAEARIVEGPACEEVARSAMVVVSVAMSDAIKAEPPPLVEAMRGAHRAGPHGERSARSKRAFEIELQRLGLAVRCVQAPSKSVRGQLSSNSLSIGDRNGRARALPLGATPTHPMSVS